MVLTLTLLIPLVFSRHARFTVDLPSMLPPSFRDSTRYPLYSRCPNSSLCLFG
ncbi:hypothetical protein WG66_011409 [Moniliophthora roreri]|nr:hypothetical protein WG66_011409 [Moniliophthora roreri]